jgi:outer membrane protein
MLIAVQYFKFSTSGLKYQIYFLAAVLFWIMSGNQALGAVTLQDSYQAALKQSETLASQEKLIELAEVQYSQIWRGILPSISANGSFMVQARPENDLAESFFPRTQPEAKLTLRQPVFRGLREYAALRQQRHHSQAEKHLHESASLLLYNDVAQTYHAALTAEENLKNIGSQLKLYDERIIDLSKRVNAGTSNETDLLTLQSSRANLISQLETAKAGATAARETFTFVTGLPRDSILAPISHTPPKPGAVKEFLELIETRPDIRSLAERIDAAQEQVSVSRGSYLPTLDLVGNYYFKRQSEVYNGINWDIQALFSVPIFTGGLISAQIRESTIRREQSELELSRLRRQAEQQIRTLHSEYLTQLDSIRALEKSLNLAEKNYQFLKRDFQRGLTRNLDVLQALLSSHEVRLALLRARYASRNTWVQLNTATGRKPNL